MDTFLDIVPRTDARDDSNPNGKLLCCPVGSRVDGGVQVNDAAPIETPTIDHRPQSSLMPSAQRLLHENPLQAG